MARSLLRASRPHTPATGRRRAFVPAVEALEMRWTPSVTFTDRQPFTIASSPTTPVVGDFNGDGRPDLAIGNYAFGGVSVLLNTMPAAAINPTFAAERTFAAGFTPVSVAVGDFNGDGRPDLAVANATNNTVEVLLNTTAPGATLSFAPQHTFAVAGEATKLAVADFNGDGRPDLAVANYSGHTVSVLLNSTSAGAATPSFAAQQTFATGGSAVELVAADFNGDGRPDLAVGNKGSAAVSVLLNTTAANAGSATFAARQTFAIEGSPAEMVAADFNGDGRPDLAVTNVLTLAMNDDNTVSVLLNTTPAGAASPSFAGQHTFTTVFEPVSVAVGDFDGDGRPDLAVTSGDGNNTVSVLLDTTPIATAIPSFAAQQTFVTGPDSFYVAAGDFNRDGRPDLVVANVTTVDSLSVILNTTTPFANAAPTVVGQFSSQGVWVFNRSTGGWTQLTPANATLLAADPQGDVAGEFPGSGVWVHRPNSGWQHLNGVDATQLAMDANGDIVAEFPGYGVGEYLPSTGWRLLTGANASALAIDARGEVAGEFPGYGVWEFHPASGWKLLNGVDASALAMDAAGDVAANFPGYGVGEYRPASGWALLNGAQAQSLAMDAEGHVTAEFHGYGVGEYLPASGWRSLTPADAVRVAMGGGVNAFGDFAGYGVWEYDPFRGWFKLTGAVASALAVA
jgi:hypothetical protein